MTKSMKIIGSDHTSFTVSNLEKSLAFYHDLLGFEILNHRPRITNRYFRDIVDFPDGVIKGAFLAIPGTTHCLELFEYVHPRGTPLDTRNNNPGSAHIALLVEDLRPMVEELKARGVRFRSEPIYLDEGPNTGGWAVYMLDPDGITIELFQAPPNR
jgi:catechol 2,3-dioxygenase-like lactoylglutathione lyase family enzyme